MRPVRSVVAAVAVVGAVATVPVLAQASPHQEPSVTSVQKKLGKLALANTQLVERYDQARVAVVAKSKAAAIAAADARTADLRYTASRQEFVQIIQAQYEGQSFGAAGALLDSNSDANYLDRLNTMELLTSHTAQVVSTVTESRAVATDAARQAQRALAAARAERAAVTGKRAAVTKQITQYRKLLATLTSAQRAAYQRAATQAVGNHTVKQLASSSKHITLSAGTGSKAARKAVEFALAQVGKPYVFGAAGPSSYDCSGLTMAAWRAGGVSLPHSAAGQYGYGQHVSRSDLQPGDLLFFYHPIGHVTIYAGDGMMVSAPTEGENVSVVPLAGYNADYVGATRLT